MFNRIRKFFGMIDGRNDEVHDGSPEVIEYEMGQLSVPSNTLAIGDPQYLPALNVSGLATGVATLSATLWQYPSRATTLIALHITSDPATGSDHEQQVGEIGIDSAKVVVADKEALAEYWTETGKDRIGVVSTARDQKLLKILSKRFKLRFEPVAAIRAEAAEPISEELEKEILSYLETIPRYADFTFMYFHVRTNNSFDRVNFMHQAWGFMPIGNADQPEMFACTTGRGDGVYPVTARYAGDKVVAVTIPFIGTHADLAT